MPEERFEPLFTAEPSSTTPFGWALSQLTLACIRAGLHRARRLDQRCITCGAYMGPMEW